MDRIERLEAIEEIRGLKARYFRLMDMKLWDELRDVFCADLKVVTPEGKIYVEGGDAYAAALRNSLEHAVSCHQGLTGEEEVRKEDHQVIKNYYLLKGKSRSKMKDKDDYVDVVSSGKSFLPVDKTGCKLS